MGGRFISICLLGLIFTVIPHKARMPTLALLLVAAGMSYGAHTYLAKEFSEDCRPCPDNQACRPIELSLEVSQPFPRVNTIYTVWHRVRLKNISCLKLHGINIGEVQNSGSVSVQRLFRRGLYFKVWDSQGREILPFGINPPRAPLHAQERRRLLSEHDKIFEQRARSMRRFSKQRA